MRYIGDEGQELTETREAIRREMEMLRKRCDRLAELAFNLDCQLSDRDAAIRELEARLSIYECPVAPDASGPSGTLKTALNAPEDQL